MTKARGKAQTVLGLLEPKELGVTLMHDHILVDLSALVPNPAVPRDLERANHPVSMEILGWLRFHQFHNYDNMKLIDERVMVEEIIDYRTLGGRTIVDPAPPEIGRNPVGLQRIARLTGSNIICGTSHYVHLVHSPETVSMTAAEVAHEFVAEIEEGIGTTGVKAGIIGEIGNSWPWHENEKKCCRAAAIAQRETGASITIHPGRHRDAPMEILRLLRAEGADLERVIMGHIENRIFELKGLERIMDNGCYIEFDAFGVDHFPFGENPSDEERVKLLAQLMRKGYTERILISQDICRKLQLKTYGGYGYSHILENIVPLLRKEEVEEKEIQRVLVENPAKVLTLE